MSTNNPERMSRQTALANQISIDTHGKPGLLVPGLYGQLGGPLPMHNWPAVWGQESIDILVWMAVLFVLNEAINPDHTWPLKFHEPPYEHWGFVTEPYEPKREGINRAQQTLAQWHITVAEYPKETAPWNPGYTTPIAVTFIEGCWDEAIRCVFRWLADYRGRSSRTA